MNVARREIAGLVQQTVQIVVRASHNLTLFVMHLMIHTLVDKELNAIIFLQEYELHSFVLKVL